jgi:hypothetical protein
MDEPPGKPGLGPEGTRKGDRNPPRSEPEPDQPADPPAVKPNRAQRRHPGPAKTKAPRRGDQPWER